MADEKKTPKKKTPKKKEFDPSKLSEKQRQSGFAGKDTQGIAQLAAQIKEQNKIAQGEKSNKERDDKLTSLLTETKRGDKEGKAQLLSLRQGIIDSTERLRQANEDGDEKLIRLEEKNLESLSDSIDTTEKEREAKKATEKQSKILEGIKGGIGNLANKFKDNAGFLAGLAGVALAVFNPEKLKEIIDRTVGAIVDAFDIVQKIFEGDFKGALEIFKENWADIGIALGLVVALNFGKIVAVIGTVKKGLIAIKAAMAAAGIGLGPAILIGAAIALVIAALVKTFQKVKSVFDETGSAFEAFKAGIVEFPAQIFGIPLDLLKKAISFIAGAFGFDTTALDEFSFTDMFRNIFTSIFEGIQGFIEGIKDTFLEFVENAPEMFLKVKDFFKDAFDSMVQKFKDIGLMIKAFGVGGIAAIKAAPGAVFGGDSPMEAFDRAYNDVMAGGNGDGSATVANLEADAATRGEELDTTSMDNKMDGQFLQTAAPAVNVVNNVDNSNNSKTSNTAIGGRSKRKRGFGTDTELAYG